MRRATIEQQWDDDDAAWLIDRQRPPLHARGQQRPPPLPNAVAPHATRTPPPPAKERRPAPFVMRRAGSAVVYGLLGFVLGAIFWHFVGFWDFVGQVMFKGRPSETQISQAPPPVKLKERVSGVSPLAVVIEPGACTTLELDRSSGATRAVACEIEALPLRSLKAARREDLWVTAGQRIQEVTARGWSFVTIEAPGRPLEQASTD